jgi:hypothetical protein
MRNDQREQEPITLRLALAGNDCGHRSDHLPLPLMREGRQSPFPDCLKIKAAAREGAAAAQPSPMHDAARIVMRPGHNELRAKC